MAVIGVISIGLPVRDLERSLTFYRDVLGFEADAPVELGGEAVGGAGMPRRLARAWRDGVYLDLVELGPGGAEAPVGAGDDPYRSVRLVVAVDQLETTLQSFRARGVEVVPGSRRRLGPGLEACAARDPDGRLVEVYQRPVGVDGDPPRWSGP